MRVPIRKPGEPLYPGQEPQLAKGVKGYALDDLGWVWVPLIIAEQPGSGDVRRFLNEVEPDRTVVVPNIIHARLRAMLLKRGWVPACDLQARMEIYVRGPIPVPDPLRDIVALVAEHVIAFVKERVRVQDILSRLDYFAESWVFFGLGFAMRLGRIRMIGGYNREGELALKEVEPV